MKPFLAALFAMGLLCATSASATPDSSDRARLDIGKANADLSPTEISPELRDALSQTVKSFIASRSGKDGKMTIADPFSKAEVLAIFSTITSMKVAPARATSLRSTTRRTETAPMMTKGASHTYSVYAEMKSVEKSYAVEFLVSGDDKAMKVHSYAVKGMNG